MCGLFEFTLYHYCSNPRKYLVQYTKCVHVCIYVHSYMYICVCIYMLKNEIAVSLMTSCDVISLTQYVYTCMY